MISSQFKKYQLKKLSAILNFSPERVQYIVDNIEEYYRERTEKKFDQKKGDFKRYKDGTVKIRTIRPSYKDMKLAQHRIKNRIFRPIPLPKNVHGGVSGRSNITNAKVHQGNKYFFVTDLQDFYPSISAKMVFSTFLRLGFSQHFSDYLCKLTTWKDCLPQGTPTSTHLSNLVFLRTDEKLIEFCAKHSITYTRYVDDLTFSSQSNFQHLTEDIVKIIQDDGYALSYRKTEYGGKPTVTGIEVFLNKIDAPQKIIDRAAQEVDMPFKPVSGYLNNIRKTNKKIYR